MNRIGDKADDSGSSLRTAGKAGAAAIGAVTAAASAAAAGVGALVSNTADYARSVDKAAAQSGMTAEKIQEIAFAAEQVSGASFDTVREGLKELALRSQEAAMGTGEAKEAFDKLGISQQFLQDASTAEIFQRVRKELQGASARMRTFAAETIFGGEAGQKLVETLGLSADQMQRLRKQARDTGQVMSGSQVQALEQTRMAWNGIWQQIKGLGKQLAVSFLPLIRRLTPLVEKGISKISKMIGSVDGEAMANGFETAFNSIRTFWKVSKRVASAVWDVWSQFIDDVSRIWDEWGGFIMEQAYIAFKNVKDIVTGFVNIVGGVWSTFVGILTGDWGRAWEGIKRIVVTGVLETTDLILGFVESVLSTFSELASRIPGMDPVAKGLDTVRGKVSDYREEVEKAKDAQESYNNTLFEWQQITSGSIESPQTGDSSNQPSTSRSGGGGTSGGQTTEGGDETLISQKMPNLNAELQLAVKWSRQLRRVGNTATNALGRGMQMVNRQLGRSVSSLITGRETFRSFGQTAVQALGQVISQLVTMIAKLSVIKGLSTVFGLGGGISTFGGLVSGIIPGLAEGGIVTGPTLAMIGEGSESEAVIPLSKLNQIAGGGGGRGTVQGAGTPRLAQGNIQIPVEVVDRAQRKGAKNLNRTGR